MSNAKIHKREKAVVLKRIVTALCIAFCIHSAMAQQTDSAPVTQNNTGTSALNKARADLATGTVDTYNARLLANANVVEAIPVLEKQFTTETDPFDKGLYARDLVKLRDENPLYWDYLANRANEALESDLPGSVSLDSQGRQQPGISDALVKWANDHQVSVDAAAEKSNFNYPAAFLILGDTGDQRAIPLLERALSSRNYSLHVAATSALILFGDPESVPLMIAACKRDPLDVARASAARLAWSSDPEAQRVAGTFITKEQMDDVRKMKALGRTIAGGENLPSAQ